MVQIRKGHRTRRTLLLGLATMAALVLFQGLAATWVTHVANENSQKVAQGAVDSVEQLARIVHDCDQERIALARYFFEEYDSSEPPMDALTLERLERKLAVLDRDLDEARRAYEPLVTLPGEAALWRGAVAHLSRFREDSVTVLRLSRGAERGQARKAMARSLRDYEELNHALVDLMQLNRQAAEDALVELNILQSDTEVLRWVLRIVTLSVVLGLGWWASRRVMAYEEEVLDYARHLEERNQDLDAFAGRVAHDLRNVLGPPALLQPLLRRCAHNPAKVMEIAERLERSTRRATALIDSLLAFSRANREATSAESAPLKPAIEAVVEELGPLLARVDGVWDVGAVPDVQVSCSPELLHVVLGNVCGNAVKFLEGQPERRVGLAVVEAESEVCIEVSDTGPGIPENVREKIFEPFFRVSGTRAPGSGIGLATVRRILEGRGGRIVVDSPFGKGARFSLWFPKKLPNEAPSSVGMPEDVATTLGASEGRRDARSNDAIIV